MPGTFEPPTYHITHEINREMVVLCIVYNMGDGGIQFYSADEVEYVSAPNWLERILQITWKAKIEKAAWKLELQAMRYINKYVAAKKALSQILTPQE